MATTQHPMVVNFALSLFIVGMVIFICKIASAILIPFVIAVFVWYLLNAIARFLGYAGLKVSTFWRLAIAVLVLFGFMFMVYEIVNQNAGKLMAEAPKYQENFKNVLPTITKLLQLDHIPTIDEISSHVDIEHVIRTLAGMLTGIAGKTLVVILYVGFLLYEQKYFARKIQLMVRSKEHEEKIRHILHALDVKVQKYIGVKSFVSCFDSVLTFIILSFFDIDFASFWAVMAFFLHFIPYAGSFLAIVLPVSTSLAQFGDLYVPLMLLMSLATSHAFIGHILDPYLMGNNLNLSPIFIISNLAMWGMIWGVPGMFLAIPILAIIVITLGQFDQTRPIAVLMSKTGRVDRALRSKGKK